MTAKMIVDMVVVVMTGIQNMVPNAIIAEMLTLARAVQASPEILSWLDKWLPAQTEILVGANAVQAIPNEIKAQISPDKIAQFVALLQMLLELWRNFNSTQGFIREQQ